MFYLSVTLTTVAHQTNHKKGICTKIKAENCCHLGLFTYQVIHHHPSRGCHWPAWTRSKPPATQMASCDCMETGTKTELINDIKYNIFPQTKTELHGMNQPPCS